MALVDLLKQWMWRQCLFTCFLEQICMTSLGVKGDNVLDNQQHISLPFSLPLFPQPSAASSTFHQARPLILHTAGGPFSMQPNVLIMCPAWSLCWWLADYHLIKRHGMAGERRACHSLRSSSEPRNNTCCSLASCLMIPKWKWFLYLRK